MPAPTRLDNRVALVTGASRGIGRAIALALAEQGARVAVNYVSRAADADAVVEAIRANGGTAVAVRADASARAEVDAMIATVAAQLGPVDILINNAGIALRRDIDELTEADFDRTIAVNLKSAFLCTQAVVPGMRERGWGRIVNISSVNGQRGQFGQTNYSTAKAGIHGFTMALAQEVAARGVTVNTVSPGYIGTDMVRAVKPERLEKIVSAIPVKRLGEPEEIASIVGWLVSDEAAFATGADFSLNGGLHMG